MTALWQIPQPTSDINSLRLFYDTLESHIRGLQSLGKEENAYGELLIPMIRDKLPNNIRKQIARDHGNKAWTLPELRKAILREIDAIQAGVPLDELSVADTATQPNMTASFHTKAASTRTTKPLRIKTCVFCKGNHYTSDCQVVTDPKRRLDIVKRDRLCYNCLGKHRVSDCKSRYTCKICKRKHHSTLHDTKSATTSEKKGTSEVHVALAKTDDTKGKSTPNGSVLLKTAVIPMSVGDRKPINATVLFDDGSNRTFITQRFADKLNLKSDTHENVSLSTFGDNSKQIHSMKSAMVTLHEQNGHTSTVNALIIPEISSNLFNHVSAEILNSDHLRGLKLAHPVSNVKTMEIDVLIGADQYWNFVGNHIVRGAGPTAISSKFGYLLSGPTGKRGKLDSDINIHHVNVETHTDDDIRNWWNLELIGVKADSQNDENTDFETYRDTHLRVENGKYIARLPWKTDHPPLPSNYAATENRTRAMVRRLTPDLTKRYDDIITDQLRRDFVEKIQMTTN
ncbi:uncharacterized protein [Ptychodera flava]|uniref:uncharacterized protein n=1 Tax=Ptychodera flava TaxID=63121 RepID=UPI00396A1233